MSSTVSDCCPVIRTFVLGCLEFPGMKIPHPESKYFRILKQLNFLFRFHALQFCARFRYYFVIPGIRDLLQYHFCLIQSLEIISVFIWQFLSNAPKGKITVFYQGSTFTVFNCCHSIFCTERLIISWILIAFCCLWNSNRPSRLTFCQAMGEIRLIMSASSCFPSFSFCSRRVERMYAW